MTSNLDFSTIAQRLAERIGALAPELLPDGARRGGEWVARCPWRADRSPGSFKVDLGGPYAGCWGEWATGERGDALDLLAKVRGISLAEARRQALAWLGEAPAQFHRAQAARPVAASKAQREAPAEADPGKLWSLDKARTIWGEAVAPGGTLVETYLASRGLVLPADAPLRFHPRAWRNADNGPPGPAVVALLTNPETAEPTGLHVTYLRSDAGGKAEGNAPKIMLGAGGVIRLTPDEEVTGGLAVAEGVETAAAVLQRTGWSPIWVATSAGAIAKFPILRGIESLTVFADADPAGMKAARICCQRWADAGREARILAPPEGDWDDRLPRCTEGA